MHELEVLLCALCKIGKGVPTSRCRKPCAKVHGLWHRGGVEVQHATPFQDVPLSRGSQP